MRTNSAIALALVAIIFGAISCGRDAAPQNLPKFRDFPAEFGGSGEMIAE